MEHRQASLDSASDVLPRQQTSTTIPRQFQVIMHNDDYTTQEFVVHVLMRFFYKSEQKAQELMLKVHQQGKAVVGCYTKDVAESKVELATSYARRQSMPLVLTAEPQPRA
ncbi:MAG: ATP-dependent Clp protease adaptor ClpS [Myxococcota bacterium]